MARSPRVHFQGAIYHVMARGVDARDVFVDERDRMTFLEGLRRIGKESSVDVIAYCLMGNHFHLAVKVGHVPLAVFMQRLLTSYCMRFNWRHERTGHLFQARYKAILCLDDRYLAGLIPYIHMNPVRAGFVSAPQDWPWSNYKPGLNSTEGPADFDPWPKGVEDVVLMRGLGFEPVDLETIGSSISVRAGIDLETLRSGSRKRGIVAARRTFVREAIWNGHKLKLAANWLGVSHRSISRYACENTVRSSGLTP